MLAQVKYFPSQNSTLSITVVIAPARDLCSPGCGFVSGQREIDYGVTTFCCRTFEVAAE